MLSLTELPRVRMMVSGVELPEEQRAATISALTTHCDKTIEFALERMAPYTDDPEMRSAYNRLVRLLNLLRYGQNRDTDELR